MSPSPESELVVGGSKIKVSNLGKIFYPKTGYTKGDVINYYIRVSPHLLPHLKNRPITLKRYPDGAGGFFFYERHCPPHRPKWVKTVTASRHEGGEVDYCVMNSLPALVWAANLADLELHTFLHKAPALTRPTAIAFDLDPGPPADILTCCRVGLMLKDMLDSLGLESFPKTSGSKGLQIYVPLNTATSYEETKAFARDAADFLQNKLPGLVVAKMQKSMRKGRVLVDWSQNDAHKTTVAAYSLRAKDRPLVSTPVSWDEVRSALKRRKTECLTFGPDEVLKRVNKLGDLFAPVLKLRQKIPQFGRGLNLLGKRVAL